MSTFVPLLTPVVALLLIQGALSLPGRYFAYDAREMVWPDAERTCVSAGGHLASVHSDRDNTIAAGSLSGSPSGDRRWLGMNDVAREGHWVWSDGSSPDDFSRPWTTVPAA